MHNKRKKSTTFKWRLRHEAPAPQVHTSVLPEVFLEQPRLWKRVWCLNAWIRLIGDAVVKLYCLSVTQPKICKIIEKHFIYLIYFLHLKHIYIQSKWEISVFLHSLQVLLSPPPPFSASVGRFIPEAVVQYQNYHINQSTNAWAADPVHLVLSFPVFSHLCFRHLSFNASSGPFYFQVLHLVLNMIWSNNVLRADFRNPQS